MVSSARLGWLLVLSVLLVALPVLAAPSFSENIRLLKASDDFRVRTQAALALGASATKRAVVPLCQALADDKRTVRIAAASALSRLKKGGAACLKRRAAVEKDSRVLAVVKKALESVAGGGAVPAMGPNTRYYISVGKLGGPGRLDAPVRAAFVRAARSLSTVGFAPAGQKAEEANRALSKYPRSTGFLLAPRVSRPKYEGGVLSIKMSVAIMSYPAGNLIGGFSKTVGMSGMNQPDTTTENDLVITAAEESMKQFLKIAPTLIR